MIMTSHSTRIGLLCLAASALFACGGGGGGSGDTARTPAPPPVNNAPSIGGVPALQVTRGEVYEFTPSASDPDGDRLSFSIENPPTWAVFDTVTGSLSGAPGEADTGTTSGIRISVSDGNLSASLDPFDLRVIEPALGVATVSWDIPKINADGSPLTDLAGFRVHYGTQSGEYTRLARVDDATATSVRIEDLEPATYFFAVTAIDFAGNESAPSAEVSKVVQP
jgi:hypothetical protein